MTRFRKITQCFVRMGVPRDSFYSRLKRLSAEAAVENLFF